MNKNNENGSNDFEQLEIVNARIDILIDEEEYGTIYVKGKQKDGLLELNQDFEDRLDKALPKKSTCTANLDNEWLDLFEKSDECRPIKSVTDTDGKPINLDKDWSRFFWAKLIRAKIQEKGTDCYLRKTDDLITYLERNLPEILAGETQNKKDQKLKLTAIYLLEMAACGTGADIRSFADRARRFSKTYLKDNKHEYFNKFYDLLARYNIGISYFHEAKYRKAALEFNWIIFELDPSEPTAKLNTVQHFKDYLDKRHGKELLSVPSILFRANIQLKLQLAYHTHKTILKFSELFNSINYDQNYGYKEAKRDLILAEAYWQMGRINELLDKLNNVLKFLLNMSYNHSQIDDQRWKKALKNLVTDSEKKYSNLTGQLFNRKIDEQLQVFEETQEKPDQIEDIFNYYKETIKYNAFKRSGYLQQVAKILVLLVNNNNVKLAIRVYKLNRNSLIEEERNTQNNHFNCVCKNKGIDLQRLGSEHYDVFYSYMLDFYNKITPKYDKDKISFLKRINKLEKNTRENLSWKKRKIEMLLAGNEENLKYVCGENCLQKVEGISFKSLLVKCKYNETTINDNLKNCGEILNDKDYESIMNNWYTQFIEHLGSYSVHAPFSPATHFLGLQRWNSSSPAKGSSLGGGYLLYNTNNHGCVDLGIAIDPGFDFIHNLFHEGFSLYDIDIVLLSHAHLDHIRDFESMIILLSELNKRTKSKKKRKIHVIMTLGIYRRLKHIINNPHLREFIDPYIIDIEKELVEPDDDTYFRKPFKFYRNLNSYKDNLTSSSRLTAVIDKEVIDENVLNLKITPTKAYHNDFSEYSDSYGFKIEINIDNKGTKLKYTFGYTGDTCWYYMKDGKDNNKNALIKQYEDCNAIMFHLGSLIKYEKKFEYYDSSEKCFELMREMNHPYLIGILHFLTEIVLKWEKPPLILMSEFGEELRGKIRLDLIKRLNNAFNLKDLRKITVLPVDVGLDIILNYDIGELDEKQKIIDVSKRKELIWCVKCETFIPIEDANFDTYGYDEALFCVCNTCKKSTSTDVMIDKLRHLYEIGRELRPK